MITILKSTDSGLEKLTSLTEGCWVNLIDPRPEEIEQVHKEMGIPMDLITYPLDLDERARIEKEDGTLLIVLRIPQYQGESADIPYITLPLGVILAHSSIVTICRSDNDLLNGLANGTTRKLSTGKRNRFLLHLFHATANKYLNYLREINKSVDVLEDQLQMSLRNREVLGLLKYQKCLTYFTTALKSNARMMARLQNSRLFDRYPEDEDLLDDVLTEIGQAIEMTDISSGILSQMMDAFASIISNNLNVVMKFLASVTIVLSLPTIVASFFGMNVRLPFEGHSLAFWIAMGISLALSLSLVILFRKKDWL
ncbi:MAG: magnesium transporter [Chloroflexi bacterium RBG_16_48_8]|nr:MAG: magnesium transporter [Chloroflexi bacterium RBG_16_48_8]